MWRLLPAAAVLALTPAHLPAAQTRVPPERTQPPSDRLLDSEGVGRAAARLASASDRVTVTTIGRSAGGRPIHLIAITAPGGSLDEIAPGGRALFQGTPPASGRARAFLSAPPGGRDGGYVFTPSSPAQVLAWYAGAVDRPDERSFADVAPLARAGGHAAIVSAEAGKGRVFLFGFSPVFRAQWRATFPLLFNAIAGR